MQEKLLDSKELARYSRQIILPGFNVSGQEGLKAARVLIVGAGGLGSPVAIYLASAGVGTLGLADFDKVEIHNLHRQILHQSDDLGKTKLDSAKTHIKALNPYVNVETHSEGINTKNALEIIASYDIVIDGSDNFPTRFLLADATQLAGKPLLSAAIFQYEGQLSFFNPQSEGPCYRCLFPTMPEPGSVPNCAEAGVIGALCGVMGSLQALETIKYLTHTGTTLDGQLLHIDTQTLRFRKLNIKRDESCPLCGNAPSITELKADNYHWSCETKNETNAQMPDDSLPIEITVEEAQALIPNMTLLDVREAFEIDICKIDTALCIPLGELANRLDALDSTETYIVYCHHGMRSLKAAYLMRNHGLKATSMQGGIDKWAIVLDQSIQRY